MPGSFIWLCLFLVVPFQSSGAPVKGKRLGRTTRLIFQNINIIANSRGQSLGDLISETRQAYAKEFFGDPLESRQVEIQGLEGFNQDTTVETFVRRAHKRFSIFCKALTDILDHWPHGFETNRKLYEKISTLTKRIQELRDKMKLAVDLFRNSTADSALTTTSVPQSNEVWTQSAFKQNKWILGVLGKLETNMRSTLLEIKDFLKVRNRR